MRTSTMFIEGTSGDEGLYIHEPGFRFESGATLPALHTAYATHGTLAADKSNVILLLPGTANTRHSSDGYVGPGKAFDTDRYFVIAVDAIGGGMSSQPSDGLYGAYPRYTIGDMVRAQRELLTRRFGLDGVPVHAVAGASMGSFQALEWCISFPDAVRNAVLLVPAPRSTNALKLATREMIDAIALDPAWSEGDYVEPPIRGLRMAGRLYYPWIVSDAFIDSMTPDRLEEQLRTMADRWSEWDAWSLIRRYEASSSYDAAASFDGDLALALGRVTAKLLLLPTSTDRLLSPAGAHLIASQVRDATCIEVPTPRGHLGWWPVPQSSEEAQFTTHIRRFLAGE